MGGSSVLSWDFCLGLESELLSGFLLDIFPFFPVASMQSSQFTPKVYVHMGHGHEIIALAAQPAEPKHAKCVNADKRKKRDARNHSPMQQ
jgi:hypothetical protein